MEEGGGKLLRRFRMLELHVGTDCGWEEEEIVEERRDSTRQNCIICIVYEREREMRRWREEMKETCKKKKCSTGHRGLLFLSILIHFFSSKGFLSGGIHLFFFSINVSLARPLIGWKRCPRSCLELMYNTKPEKCLFLICFCLFLFVCTYRNKRSGLRSFISTGEYIMTL